MMLGKPQSPEALGTAANWDGSRSAELDAALTTYLLSDFPFDRGPVQRQGFAPVLEGLLNMKS